MTPIPVGSVAAAVQTTRHITTTTTIGRMSAPSCRTSPPTRAAIVEGTDPPKRGVAGAQSDWRLTTR